MGNHPRVQIPVPPRFAPLSFEVRGLFELMGRQKLRLLVTINQSQLKRAANRALPMLGVVDPSQQLHSR